MIALTIQNAIIVCPDCGQRYDPARAAKIARVRTGDGRTIKPQRSEAQDVREPGHRLGRHHRAHAIVTARAIDSWALIDDVYALGALRFGVPVEFEQVDSATSLRFARVWDLDALTTKCSDDEARAKGERIWRATMAVRSDNPWWRAYLHELGVSPEEIARGLVVGRDNRADVLFERRPQAIPTPGPTLPGVL